MVTQECGVGVQWGWGSLLSVQFVQIIFSLPYFFIFSVDYWFLLLRVKSNKKRWNILRKMNWLKKGEKVPLLNFEGSHGIPLLNLEGDPGVTLLTFRGLPGPTFKLWRGSQVPGPRVVKSWVPGLWSHFYNMSSGGCFLAVM